MNIDQTTLFKLVNYLAIAFTALTLVGIAALMYISWDKDEDIAGVVASASFMAIISTFAAIVAAILQRRAKAKNKL